MADKLKGNIAGQSLPMTPKGGGARILGKRFQDAIIAVLNSWLKIKIVVPFTDGVNVLNSKNADVQMTPDGTVITMPPIPLPGSSGGSATVYDGAGAPSATTLAAGINYVKDNLYVDTTAQNLYYCTAAGTNSTSVWKVIIQPVPIKQFKISTAANSIINDSILGTPQDGTNGPDVIILKPDELKGSLLTETIDSVVINYTQYTNTFNQRVATDTVTPTPNSEFQFITPRYFVGQIVYAAQIPISGVLTWVEISPARQWGGLN